ncbi:MAG: cobalamin-dependent protein [Candidatus Bathyarchaeota archaeon]|nr:cobalamin-dependent protein [Candidatus Bathyarchaeota archaeon]
MTTRMLEELKDSIVVGNSKKAKRIAELLIDKGISANIAANKLIEAMKTVDERYERKEYFVIDVASAASAMRESFKVLEPYLEVEPSMVKGRVVIGSLKGNVQGLGKDIVAATLQSAGFLVTNLGVNVTPEEFVKAANSEAAQIIAVSISMEETTPYLQDLMDILDREKMRGKTKVVIGGNAASEEVRDKYGLDAYAVDAQDCLKKVKSLLA